MFCYLFDVFIWHNVCTTQQYKARRNEKWKTLFFFWHSEHVRNCALVCVCVYARELLGFVQVLICANCLQIGEYFASTGSYSTHTDNIKKKQKVKPFGESTVVIIYENSLTSPLSIKFYYIKKKKKRNCFLVFCIKFSNAVLIYNHLL